ncbi:MAG: chemotaxis protein CheW [Treponema sp.]|nr:chemotaxis protein CheW [Treponema sp.]
MAQMEQMQQVNSVQQEEIRKLFEGNSGSFLIFSINGHRYAYKSSLVKEIMYGAKVHELPFVPDYIEGVLNCRGNPYTVINTLKMDAQNSENQESTEIKENVFLLFKREDDQLSIHISNIENFFEPEEEDILEDKVKYKMKYISLFDSDRVESILCKDLGKDD